MRKGALRLAGSMWNEKRARKWSGNTSHVVCMHKKRRHSSTTRSSKQAAFYSSNQQNGAAVHKHPYMSTHTHIHTQRKSWSSIKCFMLLDEEAAQISGILINGL